MSMKEIKIKKGFVTKIMQEFQSTFHVLFKDQGQVRNLIEYSIAKFIIENSNPAWKGAKGNITRVYRTSNPSN